MREYGTGLEGLLARAGEQPCVICGGAPDLVAVYVAEGAGAERLGAQAGHTRIVPYSICNEHPRTPATAEHVERLLEAFCAAEPPTIFSAGIVSEITFFAASE